MMIYRSDYVDKIMAYVDAPFVKILTGVRRCGKSTMLHMIMDKLHDDRKVALKRLVYCSFDTMEYDDMTSKEMYNFLKGKVLDSGKTYLFLDEVQVIDGWEKVVNSLMMEKDVDIYVTGSNSKMMSSEISTYLTGRYISFRIYILSFKEFLEFKSKYTSLGSNKEEFSNYVRFGGFPSVHLKSYTLDEVYAIVKDIYSATVLTDIVKRNEIRKVDQLERIVKYVFQNIGNTFSAKSISDYLKSENRKLDNETVYSYLEKLEKAYLIHRCARYDLQGKEILKTQEKFYLSDVSLRYSVLGYAPDSVSSVLENIVYLELLRRNYTVYVGKFENMEIDFVGVRGNDKIYVQVTYEIRSESTERREYDRLLMIRDNYPKYVLRTDDFCGGNYEGIKTMHVVDFLLSDEY